MEEYKIHRNILCIDLKSFYASVECILRGLDPFTTPLVVADDRRGGGSVTLSATPYLKSKGVKNVSRVYELPKDMDIILARPRMQQYINFSGAVIEVYLEFISEDDLYVYSVDEAFLDVTNYLNYYKKTDIELAKMILDRIRTKLGLYATVGIGPNMLLAKVALDVESKHNHDFIAKWGYEDVSTKLWSIEPLSKMWRIGSKMEYKLNILGLHKVGDIANYSLRDLKRRFGILGEELYYHTHGIDMSLIQDKLTVKKEKKSYGIGQVLFKDYYQDEVILLIREMVDEVARRLRYADRRGSTISFGIAYGKEHGGGFYRQSKLEQPTNNAVTIYLECLRMFNKFYEGLPIRRIHVSASGLTDNKNYQYSMFEDYDSLDKEHKLHTTMDAIKEKFGKNSINRGSSELEYSTVKKRNTFIGGHSE